MQRAGTLTATSCRHAAHRPSGYTHEMLGQLRALLEPDELNASPFSPEPPRAWTGPNRHWVKPVNVCEVAFGEWTADGRLRHPSFREDKVATEVVREAANPVDRE